MINKFILDATVSCILYTVQIVLFAGYCANSWREQKLPWTISNQINQKGSIVGFTGNSGQLNKPKLFPAKWDSDSLSKI